MTDETPRYELRTGKFGPYFHDTHYNGFDMPLEIVLQKLNRLEEYTQRLGAIAAGTHGERAQDTKP